MKRIGIFGGTFNPIHNGHIKVATAALNELNLDYVYFIPAGIPPHKSNKNLLSANLRYDLIEESINKNKKFKVLDIEIKKRRPAYTVQTVKALKKLKPMFAKADLHFILGQDQFEKLSSWYKPEELAKLVTFVVILRNEKKTKKKLKIPRIKGLKYEILKMKPIDISSKEIREKVEAGKSISRYVPYKVKI